MILDGKQKAYQIDDTLYHCGIDVTMRLIGGKWKCVVLYYLRKGPLRFSELRRLIPDITEKMLSIQLKALESDALIERTVYGAKPPIRVEYKLTAFGGSLQPILRQIEAFGRKQGEEKGRLIEL